MLLHWFITFWGNLAGSLFVMAIIIGYAGTFSQPVYHARVVTFATAKAITPARHQIFLRGIGANWLVCLAAYLSFMGREFFSKVVGIWWPTFAFVMLGSDHTGGYSWVKLWTMAHRWFQTVANMFYIPLGIFVGTPGLSVGHYIAHSMIPSLLGNIVGGGVSFSWVSVELVKWMRFADAFQLFVGVVFWWLYLYGDDEPNSIDDELFAADKRPLVGQRSDGAAFDEDSGAQTPPSTRRKESKDPENMVWKNVHEGDEAGLCAVMSPTSNQ
jgi:hypothetical protein